jgi:hypothetical protein
MLGKFGSKSKKDLKLPHSNDLSSSFTTTDDLTKPLPVMKNDEQDSAFLLNLHNQLDADLLRKKTEYTEADTAFLRAFRGESTELPIVHETRASNRNMDHANAVFLGALHASSDGENETKSDGTLVFDSQKHKPSSSNDAAFLLAMRSSSRNDSEWRWTEGSGTFVSKREKTEEEGTSFLMSIQTNEEVVTDGNDNKHEESDTEEEEEADHSVVPSHPYMERVFLPRPLFFGGLSPRILEEASTAAKLYVNEPQMDDNDGTDLCSEDDMTKSTFSTTTMGKLFESNLLPCARNFEGALETFGLGMNPFHPSPNAEAPHPYISLYSPVWGDRARGDRARCRRKREVNVEGLRTVADASSGENIGNGANALSESDEGSVDFKDSSTAGTAAATEEANHQFLSQLRNAPDDVEGDFTRDQFSMFARSGSSGAIDTPIIPTDINDLSSRDQFCMFARGDDAGGTFIGSPVIEKKGTFVSSKHRPFQEDNDDDDSIEAAEERKAVGLNDNMAAAAAMLAGKEVDIDGDESAHGIGTAMCNMAAGGGAKAANKYGRPYSNLELTGGCVPRFSCDDPSLPHESDLGVFETKEDEKRTNEYRREKNIIEDMTVPGIMPCVVCPTQCTDADDSQSWNSRAAVGNGSTRKANNNTVIISLDGHKNSPTNSGCTTPCVTTQTYEASRVGWWNLPDGFEEMSAAAGNGGRESKKRTGELSSSPSVDVFPAYDDPIPLDVITGLWPSPQVLRNNNISLAKLHSATSTGMHLMLYIYQIHWQIVSLSFLTPLIILFALLKSTIYAAFVRPHPKFSTSSD